MPASSLNNASPQQALMTIRIIWAALILGQLGFAGVTGVIISQPNAHAAPPVPILPVICFLMLATVIPITFIVRTLMLRAARAAYGMVPPARYASASLVFWAGCEGVSFFGLITALVNRTFWPSIVVVAVALACQALMMPLASAYQRAGDGFQNG
jgi:hypothetical protein